MQTRVVHDPADPTGQHCVPGFLARHRQAIRRNGKRLMRDTRRSPRGSGARRLENPDMRRRLESAS